MDLNWLADFVVLAESGSFSRAAARRHITQPAFSRRIKALEHWTGTPLFERGSRAVTLTESGRRFLPWAETLRRQVEEARSDVGAALKAPVEPLRIAATHSLSLTFFSDWIAAVGGRFSLGPVQLSSESLAGCERLMADGRAKFLLAHSHPATPVRLDPALFRSVSVGVDALAPVASPSLAADIDRRGRNHFAHSFITYSEDSGLGRILARRLATSRATTRLEPLFTSHHAGVLKAMAVGGFGLAWLPRSMILTELDRRDLAPVRSLARWTIALDIRLFRPMGRLSGAAESFWAAATADDRQGAQTQRTVANLSAVLHSRVTNMNRDSES
jgi:LysR family transcriptional regulator, hypochlorite-specific transcription factor HypT